MTDAEKAGAVEAARRAGIDLGLVVSLDALIRAKEAMGRDQDLLTATELRAIAAKRDQAWHKAGRSQLSD